jgi:hypothetical protein
MRPGPCQNYNYARYFRPAEPYQTLKEMDKVFLAFVKEFSSGTLKVGANLNHYFSVAPSPTGFE